MPPKLLNIQLKPCVWRDPQDDGELEVNAHRLCDIAYTTGSEGSPHAWTIIPLMVGTLCCVLSIGGIIRPQVLPQAWNVPR
jgi:hypothetical protein